MPHDALAVQQPWSEYVRGRRQRARPEAPGVSQGDQQPPRRQRDGVQGKRATPYFVADKQADGRVDGQIRERDMHTKNRVSLRRGGKYEMKKALIDGSGRTADGWIHASIVRCVTRRRLYPKEVVHRAFPCLAFRPCMQPIHAVLFLRTCPPPPPPLFVMSCGDPR